MVPSVAFIIKDAFLVELERRLEDVPEMNEWNKKRFCQEVKDVSLTLVGRGIVHSDCCCLCGTCKGGRMLLMMSKHFRPVAAASDLVVAAA